MSKVRLTKKQATAIEKYKNDLRFRHWQEKVNKIRNEIIIEKCLLELSTDDFMNAFEYGYEVEPEFKENDWIIDSFSKITKVLEVDKSGIFIETERGIREWIGNKSDDYKEIRLASSEEIAEEKERRFFARNGREPWELRRRDLLFINDMYDSIQDMYDGVYIFESGFDLDESDLETLVKRGNVKVACFSHDRKDVDNE